MGLGRLLPHVWVFLIVCVVFMMTVFTIYIALPPPYKTAPTGSSSDTITCSWAGPDAARRAVFCANKKIAATFRNVCSCGNPAPITFDTSSPLPELAQVPVLVMAANRPKYLFRSLTYILNSNGVHINNIIVSIDGYFAESAAVAALFGVRFVQSTPEGTKSARVSQHYRRALTNTMMAEFPDAAHVIIIEDDLQIASDFFQYFAHSLPIFEMDPKIYCVSAWNDHGMDHAVGNPSRLYRVEGMPGLGWATSRQVVEEFLAKWLPKERYTDWDVWMRNPSNRKGRECLIPDVSRTYHFGEDGLNVDERMQNLYFRNHALHKSSLPVQFDPLDSLVKSEYDRQLRELIAMSSVLDHAESPCNEHKMAPNPNYGPPHGRTQEPHVLYFAQESKDESDNYFRLCWCLGIWDLDVRAQYHGVVRLHLHRVPVLLIAYPSSPFSDQKPHSIEPLQISSMIPAGNRKRN